MTRIRSIAVAGTLAGAAVLAVPGFAAAGDEAETIETPAQASPTAEEAIESALTDDAAAAGQPEDAEDTEMESEDGLDADQDDADDVEEADSDQDTAEEGEINGARSEERETDGEAGTEHTQDNHGAYVSSVAKDHDGGPGHGEDVSQAARDKGHEGQVDAEQDAGDDES